MAEYSVIVELLKSTLANMTAEQIIQALQVYEAGEGTELIPAALIDGLPPSEGDTMTGNEIITEVNDNADTAFIWERIAPLPKLRVIHGENSLNWLANVDPRSTSWQQLFQYPNSDRIKKMDFVIVAEVYQDIPVFQNGDWLIALEDEPGFTYTDTSKWLVLPFHKFADIIAPVFRLHSSTSPTSGIENIGGSCSANGNYSFAPNKEGISPGEASTALGIKPKALRIAEVAESGGAFTSAGDTGNSRFNMRLKTTNAIPTLMVLPSQFGFEANKTYRIDITLLGAVQGGKKSKSWNYKFLASVDSDGYVSYDGGAEDITSALNGSTLEIGSPAISASVIVTSFDAITPPDPGVFKGLIITCTGIANTNVFWTANINFCQIGTV